MKNFDLLNQFSVERVAGSKQEFEAAQFIKKIAQKYCEDLQIKPFEIEFPEVVSATLEITEPEICSFEVTDVGMAGITDSLEAEFFMVQRFILKKIS